MASVTNDGDLARTALILYGSETGNSQDVADELGRLTERLHFNTQVSELDAVKAVREHPRRG
jgi:sulfite reductase alpha subunit-like flavoprotein